MVVPSAWANVELWDREYGEARAIPSSYRLMPSHSLQSMEGLLKPAPGVRVLDAGCGTGRHSLYLARQGCEVDAFDISEIACRVTRGRAIANGLAVSVSNQRLDASTLPDDRYDVVLDSYVSCHILDDDERNEYLDGLRRLLLPGGRLYTSCMGANDEYYKYLDEGPRVTDPLNGITKRLQSQAEFSSNIAEVGRLGSMYAGSFDDRVRTRRYSREVLAAVVTS